jgi:drug/metabolite transporter (DMT)-like permease
MESVVPPPEEAAAPVEVAADAHPPHPAFSLTDVLLFCMAVIWGINFSIVKSGTAVMAPLAFNATRVSLAAGTLLIIARLSGRPWPVRRDTVHLLLLGALGNGVYQVFFIEGVSRTRAGDAALVVAATPAIVALIGRARGIERISSKGFLGIAISLAGIACVVMGSARAAAGSASLRGDLLILCGSLAWSLYSVLVKPLTHRASVLTVSAITMLGGSVTLMIVGIPDLAATHWTGLPPAAFGALAYGSFGALVLAQIFWSRGVRMLGPTRTSMYSNLQPVVALVFAWLILSESPTMWQSVGAVGVMAGIFLTRA